MIIAAFVLADEPVMPRVIAVNDRNRMVRDLADEAQEVAAPAR